MGVFSIPGNIKQAHLPFVLDPGAELNTYADKEAKDIGVGNKAKPQYFSFRYDSLDGEKIRAPLSICPQSFKDYMKKDISYRLLYKPNGSTESIDYQEVFKNIPGIQIREYLPDTRLDQALDFFGGIMEQIAGMFKADKDKTKEVKKVGADGKETVEKVPAESNDGIMTKITRVCKFAVKYLTGFANPNIYTKMFDSQQIYAPIDNYVDKGNITTYMLKFPFTFWYALQSCTTTNIYELPCVIQDPTLYSSNGNPGWGSAGLSFTNTLIENIPVIGKLVKTLLGNINISMLPWWDAKAGNATPHPEVSVEFDLFNDTVESSVFNFIFVNTIVPNNKWVQYNLFQHSPHLYDVKLEGYDRLYACSGSFTVQGKGVLRNVTDDWIDATDKNQKECLSKYINGCMDKKKFVAALKSDNLIKIPDIYHVKMTFTSLLPDNFNQYMLSYSKNSNITTEYRHDADNQVRITSPGPDMLKTAITGLGEEIKSVWTTGKTTKGEEQ